MGASRCICNTHMGMARAPVFSDAPLLEMASLFREEPELSVKQYRVPTPPLEMPTEPGVNSFKVNKDKE